MSKTIDIHDFDCSSNCWCKLKNKEKERLAVKIQDYTKIHRNL